jgi:aspartate/tyrosine/aromatic aminotransferase
LGRSVWSVTPANGAYIVEAVLSDPELRAQWRGEVSACGRRLIEIRNRLCYILEERTGRQWPQLKTAKGMFAYTGFNPEQVQKLAEKKGIFLVATGRIAIPSLNSSNVDYVANSIADIDIESRQ